MLAALSIADPDLAERILESTFSSLPQGTGGPNGANGQHTPQEIERIIGLQIKKKTVETVKACKDMLLKEPLERFDGYWTTVSISKPTTPSFFSPKLCPSIRSHEDVITNALFFPLGNSPRPIISSNHSQRS